MAVALSVIWIRNLFAATMLMGIFSLLAATLYVLLDAVDVALTEAAVGAGLPIILMLSALALTTSHEKSHNPRHNHLALTVVLVTGGALIYGTTDMPSFADPQAPAHQHVAPRYIEDSPTEIGIPNMVTSVLASYRGLDTLGEVLVIFAAGLGVLLTLGAGVYQPRNRALRRGPRVKPNVVLRVGGSLLIPLILLFALYVQFHGEFSPGGGFQAGIIFAAAFVLFALVYGLDSLQRAIPPPLVHRLAASGALLFLGVGVWAMLSGGNFLEYKALSAHPQTGELLGIILIELGVGITVASVVVSLFYSFAGQARRPGN